MRFCRWLYLTPFSERCQVLCLWICRSVRQHSHPSLTPCSSAESDSTVCVFVAWADFSSEEIEGFCVWPIMWLSALTSRNWNPVSTVDISQIFHTIKSTHSGSIYIYILERCIVYKVCLYVPCILFLILTWLLPAFGLLGLLCVAESWTVY